MDKITKNPDEAKFTNSPRTSTTDPQIEKYRLEISKKSESDFIKTRKLTIQSTVKHEAPESNEIDKQISDLESLIRRLQDEIVEMSHDAEKPYVPTEDDPAVQIKDSPVESKEEPYESETSTDVSNTEINSHVYPIIVRDVNLNLNDRPKQITDGVSDLVNYSDSSVENNASLPATLSSIQKNIDVSSIKQYFNDDIDAGESRAAQKDDHLEQLIGELKTEINDKLESLKDVSDGEPLNNSEENMNLSLGQN